MFTNTELENEIARRGGIFDLQLFDPTEVWSGLLVTKSRLDRHCQFALRELYTERPKPLRVELIFDTSLNAFAYTTPEGTEPYFDFIGINVGVLHTYLDVFSRMLAHPETFPDVENPKLEQIEGHNLPFLTTDAYRYNFPTVLPKCPIRHMFAQELSQVAIDFLFFHELTHLRNGHVDYLRNIRNMTVWQEAIDLNTKTTEPIVNQTLEFDADCGAVLHTLNAAYRFIDDFKNLSPTADKNMVAVFERAYGSGKLATRMVLFSAYMTFRLFDTPEWIWWKQSSVSHPLCPSRMFYILPTLREVAPFI